MFMTLILPFKFRPLSSSFSASDSWSATQKKKEIKKMSRYLLPQKENDVGSCIIKRTTRASKFYMCML